MSNAPDPWDYMNKLGGTDRGAAGLHYRKAIGVIGHEPKRDIFGGTGKALEGAESQMWQGIDQQQDQMAAAANRRGYNPAMARAANYAGGELESRGWGLAEQLRAQQEQQRRQMMMAALQKRSDVEMTQMGVDEMMLGEKLAGDYHMDQVAQAVTDASAAEHAEGYKTFAQSAGAIAMAMSDKRAKQNAYEAGRKDQDALIRGLSEAGERTGAAMGWAPRPIGPRAPMSVQDYDAAIGSAKGHTYEYKPGVAEMGLGSDGPRYGVMAQDVERTRLGQTMVKDTPVGKVIDGQAATGALLGMVGRLGERVEELEGGDQRVRALRDGLEQAGAATDRQMNWIGPRAPR